MRWWRRHSPTLTLQSQTAYAQWAKNYPPHAHNLLMEIEQAAMLQLMPDMAEKQILDLAGGSGRYGLIAKEKGARAVIETDNSLPMLRANPLEYRLASSMLALPFADASFDGLICALAIGHISALEAAISEMARVLRPNGWALISDFHPFAFLNGAKRTFTGSDGKTYAVEHYPHLYSAVLSAAAGSGLAIEAIAEPTIGGTPGSGAPVVIVYRMRLG